MFIFSHLLIREYLCKIFAKIHVDKLGMYGIILFSNIFHIIFKKDFTGIFY